MIILKIIVWIILILLTFIVLLFIYATASYYWPKGKKSNIYSKRWFSYEMCAISGKKNRGEITADQEYKELEIEYLANKSDIDQYALMHDNALNYSYTKWGMEYSALYTQDQNQTPIPINSNWSEDFILFSLKKIDEGVKPSFIAMIYDKYLRKFF